MVDGVSVTSKVEPLAGVVMYHVLSWWCFYYFPLVRCLLCLSLSKSWLSLLFLVTLDISAISILRWLIWLVQSSFYFYRSLTMIFLSLWLHLWSSQSYQYHHNRQCCQRWIRRKLSSSSLLYYPHHHLFGETCDI